MLIFLTLIQFTSATITVISPESLRDEFHKGIKSSLGDFGNPPYNTKIRGTLFYPLLDRDGCSPITNLPHDSDIEHYIVMFDRGNCSYSIKVKHAQQIGVKALIIANNVPGEDVSEIIMRDNGIGGNLFIPALMISMEDADRLKEVYVQKSIVLLLGFEMVRRYDKIMLSLVLSSGNADSQNFINRFYDVGQLFNSDVVDLEVHYVVIQCLACKNSGFQKAEINCMGGGRYCAPDPDDLVNGPLTGRDVIQEDLRQMCLLEIIKSQQGTFSYSKYFEFHKDFTLKCSKSLDDMTCSENIMKKLGFDPEKVNKCISQSYGQGDKYLASNTKLDNELKYWHDNSLHLYPAVLINHQLYKGNMNNSAILTGICAGYYNKNKPAFCKGEGVVVEVNEGYSVFTVVFWLTLFFGILVGILCVYRHAAKKELQKEMRKQVNAAVSQYFALSEMSNLKESGRQVVKSSYI